MSIPSTINLSEAEVTEFARELDQIFTETMDSLGKNDAQYIRRMISVQRKIAITGRYTILLSFGFLPTWLHHSLATWPIFYGVIGFGTALVALGKILENMEIGHNVLHGQWDWMRDPEINSTVWEWNHACPADQWKHSHNVIHHTWTNVLGKDYDVGYGVLRVNPKQKWKPRYIPQPLLNIMLCLFFEWGIALHDINFKRLFIGTPEQKEIQKTLLKRIRTKAGRQILKDYVLWPLLGGPFFFYVLAANILANTSRNIWTNIIIFCGHFPKDVYVFQKSDVEGETRAHWYLRQLLGSANISGGKLFHILAGNLSFQIEHHLFPGMPSNRYAEIAPRVYGICHRYGLPYNTGSLLRQYGSATRIIWRLALPDSRANG